MGPQERLNQYLREVKDTPFQWGVHDCLTFTNEAWRRMHGHGWSDDWLGRYMKDGRLLRKNELRAEYGFWSFNKAVDTKLTRIEHVPPRGALVTTKKGRRWVIGEAMGICVGLKAAFLSDEGVVYLQLSDIEKAWV